ncbi:MAG: ABC transporter permease [Eubacterium aggregans]|uniref:ABC transporter permease n=1 Tax=Eubacterium aggregans TaxID=81409 RepID=UPI002B20933B|nr:ABC transporter permease [Eubacterium aggregans]MEA5073661.1 ABC transporter permease [Eubacterium aggregans]
MNKQELIILCWENLWRMKFRTILTIIGVVIGTASIIIMVSIGNGAQQSIIGTLSSTASVTAITVSPNADSMTQGMGVSSAKSEKLNDSAIKEFKRLDGVKAVSPIQSTPSMTTKVNREEFAVTGRGMEYDDLSALGYSVSAGRLPRQSEENAIVIGPEVFTEISMDSSGTSASMDKLINSEDLVGNNLTFTISRKDKDGNEEKNSYKFRVVGVLSSTGGMDDYYIIMNLKKALELSEWSAGDVAINTKRDGYSQAMVTAADTDSVNSVTQAITDMGFQAFSMKQMLDSMDSVFTSLQMLLGGIGAVALLVACIGIVNTMTMSIYERTKEIGIMKVIGASVTDIRNMFVVESTMIGLLGGIVGILFSYLVSFAINGIASLMSSADQKVSIISLGLVAFALIFSAIVGMIAGVRPAIKAANLSSLDAIRTE